MKRFAAVLSGSFALLAASGGGASAQALEDLHTQRPEAGRWCMADHFHSGSSNGNSSRAVAEAAAISSWSRRSKPANLANTWCDAFPAFCLLTITYEPKKSS